MYADACYKAQNHDAADLCAQWRAAHAAEKAANRTWWGNLIAGGGAILSFLSVVLVLIALKLTREANDLTREANTEAARQAVANAEHTEKALSVARRNAAAAARLVKLSERNSQAQLRAYLDFDEPALGRDSAFDKPGEIYTGVSLTIKNYGRTPGTAVTLDTEYAVRSPTGNLFTTGGVVEELGTIAPTDSITKNGWFHVPEELWNLMAQDKLNLVVTVKVTYVDTFNQPRTLRSSFESFGTKSLGFIVGTRFAD